MIGMADKTKITWKGGRYGECPYVIIGNKKYFIGAVGPKEYLWIQII